MALSAETPAGAEGDSDDEAAADAAAEVEAGCVSTRKQADDTTTDHDNEAQHRQNSEGMSSHTARVARKEGDKKKKVVRDESAREGSNGCVNLALIKKFLPWGHSRQKLE